MLVEVPFFYTVKAILKGRRSDTDIDLREFPRMQVRDVSASDALVGCEIVFGEVRERLRHFEGRWWIPATAGGRASLDLWREFGIVPPIDPKDRETAAAQSLYEIVLAGRSSLDHSLLKRSLSLNEVEVRKVTIDRRPAKIAELESFVADNLIAVDGTVHYRIDQPYLALTMSRDFAASRVVFGLPPHLGKRNRTMYFPLDMSDEHEAAITEFEAATGVTVERKVEAVYGHGPSAPAGREAQDVFHAAEYLVDAAVKLLKDMTKTEAIAWYDLRDAFAAAHVVEGESLFTSVRILDERLDDLVEALDAYRAQRKTFYFAKAASLAWTLREIGFEDDLSGPSP